jgi:hypothetical protein
MDPRRILGEDVQELRGDDGPAPASAGVLDIADVRLD